MHQYLKAIGFDNIRTRKDLIQLLDDVKNNFTHQTIVSYRPEEDFCEYQKEYGQCIGITICIVWEAVLPHMLRLLWRER